MPGKSKTFVYEANYIPAILAWGTAPGVAGAAVTIVVAGGAQKKV